jgi:hypothetical protein
MNYEQRTINLTALQPLYRLYNMDSVPVEPATKVAEDSGIRNLLAGFCKGRAK